MIHMQRMINPILIRRISTLWGYIPPLSWIWNGSDFRSKCWSGRENRTKLFGGIDGVNAVYRFGGGYVAKVFAQDEYNE